MQSFARFLREASADKPETLLRMPLDVTHADKVGYVAAVDIFGVQSTSDEHKAAQAYADDQRRYKDLPFTDLDPKSLIPTQHTLLSADVEKFRGGATAGILVLKMNGMLFIVDGHHRAAAAVLDGDVSILGRVIDTDA